MLHRLRDRATRAALLIFIAAACVSSAAQAQDVGVGLPAPPVKVAEWIKGAPVDLAAAKGKNIIVLEFWATWCGPCKSSIPHLTEVQKKYREKGVLVVGVTNEGADKVRPFVQQQAEKMEYTVACDSLEGVTNAGYMEGFAQRGIPYLFIVDKAGNVAWHGSPFDRGFESTLDQIIAGAYDIKPFQTKDNQRLLGQRAIALMDEYFGGIVVRHKTAKDVAPVGESILKVCANDPENLNVFAWTILDDPRVRDRDLPLALRAAEAAHKATEGKSAYVLDTYARALFDNGRVKDAIETQKKALEACTDAKAKPGYQQRLEKYQKAVTDA